MVNLKLSYNFKNKHFDYFKVYFDLLNYLLLLKIKIEDIRKKKVF